jgi:ADP-dependent phosphofructokinase/glucokinase
VVHTRAIETDQPPKLENPVESIAELKAALKYCKNRGENHEVDYTGIEPSGGKKYIGGQGGIISNFLAETDSEVILYTPHLSSELVEMMNEKILYPVKEDGEFYLKNVQDAVNSDKTKRNHIFEFEGDRSGRLILSGRLKGYGPYLPKDIEKELSLIQENIDCCIMSGFHNVTGNKTAKLKRSGLQLAEIDKPVHVEYVHKDDKTAELIAEYVIPEADSLGLDETEIREIAGILGLECPEELNFGEAFSLIKKLLEELDLSRIHLHTYTYHITVVEESYPVEPGKIRGSMLYGELSAIQSAEKDGIPSKDDIRGFNMEDKRIQDLQELKDFGEFHSIEGFEEEGTAQVDGFKVVGIPIINHVDPARTVGMGDIISSGAFSMESMNR